MKLLINEQQKSYGNAKICCIFWKKLKIDMLKLKNIVKLEITIVFQNGSNLVASRGTWRKIYFFRRKSWKIFYLYGSNRKRKYRNWQKWKRLHKKQYLTDSDSARFYWYLINNARFMACSSWNLVNNLAEVIHKTKCKYRHDDKRTCGTKYCDCFLK